jgi:hypothetical protein
LHDRGAQILAPETAGLAGAMRAPFGQREIEIAVRSVSSGRWCAPATGSIKLQRSGEAQAALRRSLDLCDLSG